jgi:O-antigen/teichoic acid export membrane protein
MSALPYAMLRKENRPRKYALTKLGGILVYVFTIVFLFTFGGEIAEKNESGAFASFYHKHWGIGFILFANVLQAATVLLLLLKELSLFRFQIDRSILKNVLIYGWPVLIAGFAGQINDNVNRYMFMHFYKGSNTDALRETGFYGAAVRLSILISLGVQAFRMAAEPFFFSIAKDKDAKQTYARVMKWFVVILAVTFLNVTLFIDIWKYFVSAPYRQSMGLVPILLMANIFIGIYYNLTIWYKLIDKTNFGAYIMMIGAATTIIFNWVLIPVWGYTAAAWGTLLSNGVMMYLSYTWGQKYYPVPYDVRLIVKYLAIMLFVYGVHAIAGLYITASVVRIALGAMLFGVYLIYILKQEKNELKGFPVIGKRIR